MKNLAIVVSATGLVAAITLAGCGATPDRAKQEAEKVTPTVTESERSGTSSPSDITPVTARVRVSDLKVGTALAADGSVADNENLLHPGKPLHASVAVGDVAAGSKLKAVWIGPGDQRIGDEIKDVAAGAAFVVFQAPNTATWAAGDYKVEIYLGDELAISDNFDIVAETPKA